MWVKARHFASIGLWKSMGVFGNLELMGSPPNTLAYKNVKQYYRIQRKLLKLESEHFSWLRP